jgi:hypothetical protein
VLADGVEDGEQAARGEDQSVAVGQEDAPDLAAEAFAATLYALQHLALVAGTKAFLRCGVHFAESAVVPRTAVGDRQDQRLGFAGWPVNRFDVTDRDGGWHGIRERGSAGAASGE